jgi:hypothetical protein
MTLIDSASTAGTIISNLSNFHFALDKLEDNQRYTFKVDFFDSVNNSIQTGYLYLELNYSLKGIGRIKSVTIDLEGFGRPLGHNNDNKLFELADIVLQRYNL